MSDKWEIFGFDPDSDYIRFLLKMDDGSISSTTLREFLDKVQLNFMNNGEPEEFTIEIDNNRGELVVDL